METPETLVDDSLAFQPAKSPIAEDKPLKEVSGTSDFPGSIEMDIKLEFPVEVSVAGVQGNGVKASVDKDVVVAADRFVEREVLIERRSVTGIEETMVGTGKNGGMGGEVVKNCLIDDGVSAETRMIEGSLGFLENGEESEVTRDNGKKRRDLFVTEVDSAVNEKKEVFVDEGSKADGASRLNVGDYAKKIGVSGTGISLIVDVHGSSVSIDKDNGSEMKCLLFSESKENPTSESKVREKSSSNQKSLCKEDEASSFKNGENPDANVTELLLPMNEIKNCGIVEGKGKGKGKEKVKDPSMKKKRNKDSEVRNDNDEGREALGGRKTASSSKKAKKTKLSRSPPTTEHQTPCVENGDARAKEERNMRSASRDRKKSKYLSPPYTDLGWVKKSLISIRDSETETPEVFEVSPGEECHSGAAFQLIGYPPNPSKKPGIGRSKSKRNQKKSVLEEINASADEMLYELLSTALDAQYLKEHQSSDSIEGFFCRFRSSLYRNGSNYEVYNKHPADQAGTKRESLDAKPGLLWEDSQETGYLSPEGKSQRKKRKRKEEAISESPQIKQSGTKRESLDAKPGLLPEESQETAHLSTEGKSEQKKRKRKKETISESCQIKLAGTKKESLNAKHILLREDFPETERHSPEGKSGQKKRKRKEEPISESPQIKVSGAKGESLDVEAGLLREDLQVTDHPSPEGNSEQKRKQMEEAISESPQIKLASTERESLDGEPGLLRKDLQETNHLSPGGESEQKKRERKKEAISESPQIKLASTERESLNAEPGLLRKDMQVTKHLSPEGKSEQKKRNRKKEAISENPQIKLASTERESLDAGPGLLRKYLQVTNHLSPEGKSEQKPEGKSEQKKRKRKKEAISEGPQIKLASTMRESLDSGPGLLREDLQVTDHHSLEGKSEQKKIKRMEETILESPQIKLAAGTSVVKTNHKKGKTNGESLQAALLLTFAPGFSLPSKDDLIMVFGRFGALNKLETEVLKDSGCAQVVYIRSSDAEEAVKNLQKINPFGPSVISYGLRYLPEPLRFLELVGNSSQAPISQPRNSSQAPISQPRNSSQAPISQPRNSSQGPISQPRNSSQAPISQPRNSSQAPISQPQNSSQAPISQPRNSSQAPISQPRNSSQAPISQHRNSSQAPTSQPQKGVEIPASPSVSLPPAGEAPPLHSIRQNLEMMTSMLAKSGDKLSPKVKANLEGEIKGLLKKISTMKTSCS